MSSVAQDLGQALHDITGGKLPEKEPEKPASDWEWTEPSQKVAEGLAAGLGVKDNTCFSVLFGWTPEEGDFCCKPFEPSEETPEAIDYRWPKEQTEAFVRFMEQGDKVRLVGPPGTGKTELARQYCAVTGRKFGRLNFNIAMEPEDLLGSMQLIDGETKYIEGDFVRWVREGYTVLLDEINRAPAAFQMILQNLTEKGGKLHLPQKLDGDNLVTPHPDFQLIAADNTKGVGDGMAQYGSACVQDVSSLNRWEATIEIDYLPLDQQKELMMSWADLPHQCVDKLATVTQLLQDAFRQGELDLPFTPRNMRVVAEYTSLWKNPVKALKYAYSNSLAAEQQATVARIVHDTVGFPGEFGRIQ